MLINIRADAYNANAQRLFNRLNGLGAAGRTAAQNEYVNAYANYEQAFNYAGNIDGARLTALRTHENTLGTAANALTSASGDAGAEAGNVASAWLRLNEIWVSNTAQVAYIARAEQYVADQIQNENMQIQNIMRINAKLQEWYNRINSPNNSIILANMDTFEDERNVRNTVATALGYLGAYGGTGPLAPIYTNVISNFTLEAAREKDSSLAQASRIYEAYIRNFSKPVFAANANANNEFKTALNDVISKANAYFADKIEFTTQEVAFRTAAAAYSASANNMNSAALQAAIAQAAKTVAGTGNENLKQAISNMMGVELKAVATTLTSDGDYTNEELDFTRTFLNLSRDMAFNGSNWNSRVSAYNAYVAHESALQRLQQLGPQVAQAVFGADVEAYQAFNQAYSRATAIAANVVADILKWEDGINGNTISILAQMQMVSRLMNENVEKSYANIAIATNRIADATTNLVQANAVVMQADTARAGALNAVVDNVRALTAAERHSSYAAHLATLENPGSTPEQIESAKVALASAVEALIDDTDTGNDPSDALKAYMTAYQSAQATLTQAAAAKATAETEVTDAVTERAEAVTTWERETAERDDFVRRAQVVIDAETALLNIGASGVVGAEPVSAKVETLGRLSMALRGSDPNDNLVPDYDKPIEILHTSTMLHKQTLAAEATIVAYTARVTALNDAIEANKKLIERNTVHITEQARQIAGLRERLQIATDGVAAAYTLSGAPQIPGRLTMSISAGEFDGEEAMGLTFHGQITDRLAFSGAVVRSGQRDGLAAGVTIGF